MIDRITMNSAPPQSVETPRSKAEQAPATSQVASGQDQVELSGKALAEAMKQCGASVKEIASTFGITIPQVNDELGLVPRNPPSAAPEPVAHAAAADTHRNGT